ncbi:MAG TPA: hypothetical protein VHG91_04715 [Longimicrobium sp.]|nr:hypothetical protein [Longimicrobium sp.]
MKGNTILKLVLALALFALPGCIAAAAGAGAAAGIHLTSQGAEGVASEGVAAVATRARSVMAAEGITGITVENEESGTEREYRGMKGEMEVHVKLEARDGGGTLVRASAREGTVEWNKDYARTLVARITGG